MTDLATHMRVYEPEHVLSGPYLYTKWDPHLVQQLLTLLSADSAGMRIDVQTSDYDSMQQQFVKRFEVRSGLGGSCRNDAGMAGTCCMHAALATGWTRDIPGTVGWQQRLAHRAWQAVRLSRGAAFRGSRNTTRSGLTCTLSPPRYLRA